MKARLVDTDILSYYMRGHQAVVSRSQEYLKEFGCFNVSSLTVFEILKGLRKKGLKEKEEVFQNEILKHNVISLDYGIMDKAASLLTTLEQKGIPIAHADLFIASTAIVHELILVTNNTPHFSRVEGLMIENWVK